LITVKSDELTEKQLAEIAVAIQNRWDLPTFVKMHEIVVDDAFAEDSDQLEIPIEAKYFESGMRQIMDNLEMTGAFEFQKIGKTKYRLKMVDQSQIPTWMRGSDRVTPEGVLACPHCVPPDTLILGDIKLISEYARGDTAIGQSGLKEVIQKFVRPYEGDMITIKANGMLPITTTPEHPILVTSSHSAFQKRRGRFRNEILFSKTTWVAAKDVIPKTSKKDGNYVIVPIIKGTFERHEVSLFPFIKKRISRHKGFREFFPVNQDTAWLLGLFTAEGSVTKEVRFSLNKNEEEIRANITTIAKQLGYSTYVQYVADASSMLVSIPSRVLARALDNWCGHRAPNKKIPDFILFHSDERILRAFLQGYEIGDSYDNINKLRGNKIYRTCVTTSRILAQQLQLAYVRLGIWAGIYVRNSDTEEFIMGRKCSLHTKYAVSFPLDPNAKRQKVRFLEDKVLCPIRNITKMTYDGKVHNIGTTDGTYLVSNAVVHNCGKWFRTDFELNLHTKLHYIL
jgi:hypothetical protein